MNSGPSPSRTKRAILPTSTRLTAIVMKTIAAMSSTIASSERPIAAPQPPDAATVLPAVRALVKRVESVEETEVSGVPQLVPPTAVQTAVATPSAPFVKTLTTIEEKSPQLKANV